MRAEQCERIRGEVQHGKQKTQFYGWKVRAVQSSSDPRDQWSVHWPEIRRCDACLNLKLVTTTVCQGGGGYGQSPRFSYLCLRTISQIILPSFLWGGKCFSSCSWLCTEFKRQIIINFHQYFLHICEFKSLNIHSTVYLHSTHIHPWLPPNFVPCWAQVPTNTALNSHWMIDFQIIFIVSQSIE